MTTSDPVIGQSATQSLMLLLDESSSAANLSLDFSTLTIVVCGRLGAKKEYFALLELFKSRNASEISALPVVENKYARDQCVGRAVQLYGALAR